MGALPELLVGRWRKSVFGAIFHWPDPPISVMVDPQQPVGWPRGLPAEEASWVSKGAGIHERAKAHMYFILGF